MTLLEYVKSLNENGKSISRDSYVSILDIAKDEVRKADRDMAQATEMMAHHAGNPQNIAYKNASKDYRKHAMHRAEYKQLITELGKISPRED